ncbi:sulfurtransferase-like selenium metabolism protein YedF [Fundidesulfovibrio terrae]|uniref:sulfurtransferase-like selenium metabolism protein YedF n=1 Tax=Fundidesulfovibrio terrae TaxID=2922866 RepID=UPI001FAF1D28|nr:sulfurtransferase-like selenium metabolism protein YedF [Fundidesulfovibrio terrae]
MSVKTLDCLGMTCPQPLMACRACLETEAPEALTVLVDDEAALENVTRFLTASGYQPSSAKDGRTWIISAARGPEAGKAPAPAVEDFPCPVPRPGERTRVVVFLTAETIGRGDDGLGGKLMGNFLKTLPELGQDLWRVVMVNGAVKLAALDSPHLDALKVLEAQGVDILVCGTCLEFFGLMDKRAVGQTTNMLDVVTSLQLATKVIDL